MTGTTERRRRPGRKPPPLRIWPKQSIASKLGRRRRYEVTAEEALLAVLLEEGNLRVPSLVGVQRFLSGADGVEQLGLEVRGTTSSSHRSRNSIGTYAVHLAHDVERRLRTSLHRG